MAKKDRDNDDDLDVEEPDTIGEEDQVEDDTAYTMGDIVVSDGGDDDEEEDKQILKQKASLKPAEEEDDDVWIDDVDVFDDSDPYLESEDYDSDNASGYYD